jgi:hypothetical protein
MEQLKPWFVSPTVPLLRVVDHRHRHAELRASGARWSASDAVSTTEMLTVRDLLSMK